MKDFTVGQTVLVAKAFADGSEGLGVIVKKIRDGWYKVSLGDNTLEIEEERLLDARSECERRREEFLDKNPKFKIKW